MRTLKLFALCSLATAALLAAGPDEILLRRELKEGARDVYNVNFTSKQTFDMAMIPEMEFASKMKMALGVKSVDEENGKASLDVEMTEIVWDFGEMAGMIGGAAPELPTEMKMAAKVDRLNRLSGISFPGMGTAGMMMMGGNMAMGPMFIEFPEKAVRIGDIWEIVVPGSALTGGKDTTLTATLLNAVHHNDIPAYNIGLKGAIPLNADLSDMAQGPMGDMKILMKGTIEMTGNAVVEQGSGRTLSMDVLMISKQAMDLPDMSMQINIAGRSNMRLALVEDVNQPKRNFQHSARRGD